MSVTEYEADLSNENSCCIKKSSQIIIYVVKYISWQAALGMKFDC